MSEHFEAKDSLYYGRMKVTMAQLKWIAMITMAIDHGAVAIIYQNNLHSASEYWNMLGLAMRLIGRMAFPLYCFMLVQGFIYTRNWGKYALRVALFAVLSEIPFNLVVSGALWEPDKQNTIILMFIGLLCMKGIELGNQLADGVEESGPSTMNRILRIVLTILIILVGMLMAELIHADYGAFGISLIMVFYLLRNRPVERTFWGCTLIFAKYRNWYTFTAWIAFFFIGRYNGERGKKMGYLPYLFYPVHLVGVYVIGQMCV